MEESDPRGIETGDLTGATDEARRLGLDAVADLSTAMDMIRDEAVRLVAQAESETAAQLDLLRGQASLLADQAVGPVAKYVDKIAGRAASTMTDAYSLLFASGAEPLTYGPLVAEDIETDDPYGSAMAQLIAPIFSRGEDTASESAPCYDQEIRSWTNCQAAEPSADLPPSPIPPPIITSPPPTSPPPWCQPPASPPTCPPPQIVVVPMPPPCPVVEPVTVPPAVPPEPEPPAEPTEPTEPTEPPTEPEPENPDPVSPPGTVPPPVVVVPPQPVPPKKPAFKPHIFPQPAAGEGDETGWDEIGYCSTIGAVVAAPAPVPVSPAAFTGGLLSVLSSLDSMMGGVIGGITDAVGGVPPTAVAMLGGIGQWVGATMNNIIATVDSPCVATTAASVAVLGAAGWAESLSKAPMTYLAQGAMYDLQWCNPQYLPSQSQVNQLRLGNTITSEVWECLTKANGSIVWPQKLLLDAARERPNTNELITLYRRGQISFDDLFNMSKENGVQHIEDLRKMLSVGEYVPGYQDIVRFMVRDVFDPSVVIPRKYDEGFTEKYTGQAKDWARANGITDDVMLSIWRAHWRTPSYTQGVEMLHRLRPDKPGIAQPFSVEDLKKMLMIDDMAPGYIDQMIEMSYNPVTRTDLLQFYTNGAMDEAQVESGLMDTGYNERDAKLIVAAWKVEKSNRIANRGGLFTRRVIVRSYKEGEIDRDEADALLARSIPSPVERAQMLDDADLLRHVERKRKCIKAIRRKRITGEIDERESRRELVAQGMNVIHADEIAVGWTCEIDTQSKEPRAQWVLDWFISGVIDVAEADKRLRNLRYSSADVSRMIETAVLHEVERRQKLAIQQAEKQERRAAAAAKEAERVREKQKKMMKEMKDAQDAGGQS